MSKNIKPQIAAIMVASALMFAWTGTQAMWAGLSDAELIKTSNLIVVGTLSNFMRATNPSDGRKRTVGTIEIETILKGKTRTKTVRINVPQPGRPVSSSDITYRIGQKGLWFLRLLEPKESAIYAADHPQRFVPFADAEPRIQAVRKFLER